jgi:hypothetical protein
LVKSCLGKTGNQLATVRLIKNIYSVPDDKTDQRAKSANSNLKVLLYIPLFYAFQPCPSNYCKYTMTTPTPVQRTLFTLWEMKVKRMSSVSASSGCPSIVTTFTLIEENPDAGQIHPVALWIHDEQ